MTLSVEGGAVNAAQLQTQDRTPEPASDRQETTIEELMVRYQQADPEATRELIRRLSPSLSRFLAGPLWSRPYVEDLLQDCWLRIHQARHSYRPGNPVAPWVFAIARHARADVARRLHRSPYCEQAPENLEERVAAPGGDPRREELWDLVSRLPPSQYEVVFLLKVTGLSLEEVARATGSTVGAVKQKAHRAYQKLRSVMVR
jgi:RNA polymerase sigma-70 factor (ECF subfamily)